MTKEKFLKIAQQKDFFGAHQKVLLALSGGKDSMTLLNWLYETRETLDIELYLAHVNYGLRAESDDEMQSLQQLSTRLQLPFFVKNYEGKFTESDGRKFRYEFFAELMKRENITALVTAHHANDTVETILMREITGRRLRHLTGIAERQKFANGELIRPLLNFDKAELAAENYFEDASNHENHYLRNRIRNQIIPQFTAENPQFTAGIIDLSNEITAAFTVIREKIDELKILSDQVDLVKFDQQSESLQNFILQEYLAKFTSLQLSKAQFNELLQIIRKPQQYHHELNKSYNFVKTASAFYIEKKTAVKFDELEILTENPFDETYMAIHFPQNGEISHRKRQAGDVILVKNHHKKLRKYFIEEKIPLAKRQNEIFLLDNEIYAVANVVCSDLSKACKNDKMRRTLWVKSRNEGN